jgi:hypothetical protein
MIEAASLSHRRTGCQTLRGLLVSLAGAWICAAQAQGDPGILRRAAELRESPAPNRREPGGTARAGLRHATGGAAGGLDTGSNGSRCDGLGPPVRRGLARLANHRASPRWRTVGQQRPARPDQSLTGGASGGTTVPTTTVGIRGLSAEDIAQAQPNAEAVAQMEALRQSEAQARAFASGATLVSQTVTPLPSPPAPSNASMAGGAAQ